MGMTTNTRSNSAGVVNLASGVVVTDGVAAVPTMFTCGFTPRYVKWVNLTNFAMTEYFDGMAAGSSAAAVALGTVAAGTRAMGAAGTGIVVGPGTVGTAPNLVTVGPGQFNVPAALIPASSTFAWQAMG